MNIRKSSSIKESDLSRDICYIYVIISNENIYIGQTNNPVRRFKDHYDKKVKSTKRFLTYQFFIVEKCENRSDSLKREKYYKTAYGRNKIRTLIKEKRLEEYRGVV